MFAVPPRSSGRRLRAGAREEAVPTPGEQETWRPRRPRRPLPGSSEQRGLDTLEAGADEWRTPWRARGTAGDRQGLPAPPPGDSSGLSPSIAHHEGSSRAPPCAPGPGPPVRPQPSPGSSALPSEAPACRPGGRRPSASLCSRLAKGHVPPSRRHRCVCHNPRLGLRTEQLPASSQALSVGVAVPTFSLHIGRYLEAHGFSARISVPGRAACSVTASVRRRAPPCEAPHWPLRARCTRRLGPARSGRGPPKLPPLRAMC